jgi:phytoene/squalene synthetase
MASDQRDLGRYYFPIGNYDSFDENIKNEIIRDIEQDFRAAKIAINKLHKNSRVAVTVAFKYYLALLTKLKSVAASNLKNERIRVNNFEKLTILAGTLFGQAFNRKNL